jgi:CHAT domain-containing protein
LFFWRFPVFCRPPALVTILVLTLTAPLLAPGVAPSALAQADRQAQADRLLKQAEMQASQKQFPEAVQSYQQALSLYQGLKQRGGEQEALTRLGLLFGGQNNYTQGVEYLEQALGIAQERGDRPSVLLLQATLGAFSGLAGNPEKALTAYQQALVTARELKDRRQEAAALSGIGMNYSKLQDYPKAIAALEPALLLYRQLQTQPDQAGFASFLKTEAAFVLSQLAEANKGLGRYTPAIARYQEALVLFRQTQNFQGETLTLTNLSLVYASIGDYANAIVVGKQQRELVRATGDPMIEWQAVMALSANYGLVGDFPRLLELSQEALGLAQKVTDPTYRDVVISSSYYAIASGQFTVGNYDKALEGFRQSIALLEASQSVGKPIFLWRSWQGLGTTYLGQRNYPAAIEALQKATALARANGILDGEQSALSTLADVYRLQKNYPQGIATAQQAIALTQQLKDRGEESAALNTLGGIYFAQQDYPKAIAAFQQSVAIAQETKRRPKEADSLSRLGLSLLKAGRAQAAEAPLRAAIQIQESLRQRLGDTEKVALFDFTQKDPYSNLQQVLVSLKQPEAALEISERGRARAFVELLAARSRPQDAPTITPPTLAQIRQIAQTHKATLVQYSVINDETLYIWVVQPAGQVTLRSVDLKPLLQDQKLSLADYVQRFRSEGIGARGLRMPAQPNAAESRADLKALHRLLIAPIAELLPANPNDRVIFIPQGALFLVPFAALQDAKGRYLVQNHTLLTAPSIQVLELTRQQRTGRSPGSAALIVGNPTMPKIVFVPGEPAEPLPELPGAEVEAKTIAQFLKTTALTGDRATKAVVKQQMATAKLIHLATHGLLDDQRGIGSAIALAPSGNDNGFLTAEEILDLKLNADLVVLSACDTGRGKITGDGVIGLSRSLISAGAPSVIVSLWAVPDAPTSALMTEFYQNLQKNPDKAQALRQAMLTTLKQHPNPRDWAAFTLIGEAE